MTTQKAGLTPERKDELRKLLRKMTLCSEFVTPQQALLDSIALTTEVLDAYDALEERQGGDHSI